MTDGILNPVAAQDLSAPKWGPHIDLEGKAGTDRNLGETDLFIPLSQDDETLFFTNLRARMDDNDSREGNFGLGVRHMLDSGWNLGGITYFDRRKSPMGNMFNQLTFGAEALSMDWDLRANAYVPVGRTSHDEDSLSTATISGASIIFHGGEERSLGGFDAEIGWRAPLFDENAGQQLRLYGGGYRFSDDRAGMIAGPRGRFDLTFDEVPFLWQGSRLSLGAEVQHDDPRGTQSFASFRLRIPLQVFSERKTLRQNLSPIEKRMTDPVIRDIDVVTEAGSFGPAETGVTTMSGGVISVIDSASTTTANLATAVANAGANSTVILQGNYTGMNGAKITLQSGQTLMGSGTMVVKSPSGRTATMTMGSASLSGTGQVAPSSIASLIQMANNSTLDGITVSNSANGGNGTATILISGVSNVTIKNSTLTGSATGSGTTPIFIQSGASNITITGNTLSAVGSGTINTTGGAMINVASNVTFSNNSVSATNGTNRTLFLINATNLSGSGNTRNAETCETSGTNTGSISFTDNTTCP
ncbi:inverse autotransporter beta domain-containing protein [Thalassospira sp. CH_XMU1448-2]|uniref:inverse autotransporter beta domain-containing protein n=1 Tax=Thalassospira sp. CH_XMU1448-2 TaxID=3107773 RepID=UPI0030080DA2